MLSDSRTLLTKAVAQGYAIGAFNTYNLEITLGILKAAEAQNAPVVLQVGESALDYGGEASLSKLVLAAAEDARIPVVVHLDHARDVACIRTCLELGYLSVMFDGSDKPFHENISATAEAVRLAHSAGAQIEAELGLISGEEDGKGDQSPDLPFTDPGQADVFVKATNVDSLAVAIGNSHGFYDREPCLDFTRLQAIHEVVDCPLVLHGASGISDSDLQLSIQQGIRKINVNTEIRSSFFQALRQVLSVDLDNLNLPQLMNPVIDAVQHIVMRKIEVFGSSGKA